MSPHDIGMTLEEDIIPLIGSPITRMLELPNLPNLLGYIHQYMLIHVSANREEIG